MHACQFLDSVETILQRFQTNQTFFLWFDVNTESGRIADMTIQIGFSMFLTEILVKVADLTTNLECAMTTQTPVQ